MSDTTGVPIPTNLEDASAKGALSSCGTSRLPTKTVTDWSAAVCDCKTSTRAAETASRQ